MTDSFWKEIREDFPITKKRVYLDHASAGPIPRPVKEKIQQYYEEHFNEADFSWFRWMDRREKCRQSVAKLINAEAEEIAFTHSTSQGMNFIAALLANKGKALINTLEFPSSTLPWIWRKADLIWQEPENFGVSLEKLQELMAPAKTIISSYVQYATGFRQDLESLGKSKGDRYLVVNSTQGLGALPVDVKKWNADFLCSNSYKWMMAGYGGGILYINKKWISQMDPDSVGWRSMEDPDAMNNQKIDLRNEAARYEMGVPSFPTIFGVGAAAEYFMQVGLEKIEERILMLTDFAIQNLEKKGFEVITPREKKHRSGIVVFKVDDPKKTQRRLLDNGVYASIRGEGLRIAPHFYNSIEDLEKFLKYI